MKLKFATENEIKKHKIAEALATIVSTTEVALARKMVTQWLRTLSSCRYVIYIVMNQTGKTIAVIGVRHRTHWMDVEARWIMTPTARMRDRVRLEFEKFYRGQNKGNSKPMWWWLH